MMRLQSPLLILACIGLLASQLSGLHMHVDGQGYAGAPASTHVHRTAPHSHDDALGAPAEAVDHDHPGDPDHAGDRDISVVELGAGSVKLLIFIAWIGLALLVAVSLGGTIRISPIVPAPKTHRDRWRPPLRAPPPVSLSPSRCTR